MKIINILIVLSLSLSLSFAQSNEKESEVEHQIKYGETLWHLSQIYNVHVDSIKKWNNISIDSDKIIADKSLIIKLNSQSSNWDNNIKYHIVKKGEYLGNIASEYKISMDSIIKWNNKSNNMIFEGELLYLSSTQQTLSESKVSKFFNEQKQSLEKEIENPEKVEFGEEKDSLINNESDSVLASEEIDSILQEIQLLKGLIKTNEDWFDLWMIEYDQKIDSLDSSNPIQVLKKLHLSKRKSEVQDSIELEILNLKTRIEFCEIELLKQEYLKYISNNEEKLVEIDADTVTSDNEKIKKETVEFNPKKIAFADVEDEDIVVFDNNISNLEEPKKTKRYKKLQNKIENEGDKTISLNEVTIKESRKEKYEIGDEVDEMSLQKSEFYLRRAKNEIDNKDFKKANNLINKSLSINPSLIEAYMIKGDLFALFDFYDKALENYKKAQSLDRNSPQIYYNIGNCLIYQGKSLEALAAMRKAIKLDSTYVLGYYGRAIIYLEKKQYKDAINDFNAILNLNAYFFPAVKGRGVAYLNSSEYKKAIIDFNTVLNFDNEDEKTIYLRGLAKLYLSNLYDGCMDLLKASEMGYSLADKDLNKYCK